MFRLATTTILSAPALPITDQPDEPVHAAHKHPINRPYQTFMTALSSVVGTLPTRATQNQGNLRGGRVVCPRKLSSGSFFSTICRQYWRPRGLRSLLLGWVSPDGRGCI